MERPGPVKNSMRQPKYRPIGIGNHRSVAKPSRPFSGFSNAQYAIGVIFFPARACAHHLRQAGGIKAGQTLFTEVTC